MASNTMHGLQKEGHHEQHCLIVLASPSRTKRNYSSLLPRGFDTEKNEGHHQPAFALYILGGRQARETC